MPKGPDFDALLDAEKREYRLRLDDVLDSLDDDMRPQVVAALHNPIRTSTLIAKTLTKHTGERVSRNAVVNWRERNCD